MRREPLQLPLCTTYALCPGLRDVEDVVDAVGMQLRRLSVSVSVDDDDELCVLSQVHDSRPATSAPKDVPADRRWVSSPCEGQGRITP